MAVDGGPVALPRGKPQALLAYLLLYPRTPHTREQLLDALWPEAPTDRARRYLSNALYRLREALGNQWLEVEAERLSLRRDRLWVDVWEFERLAASAAPADWDEALALYAGELLPEVYADWVLLPRLAVRERQLALLTTAAEACARAARWPEAAAHFRRLAAADPLNEAAQRGVMHALARLGRLAEALEVFEQLQATLRSELDVPPSSETRGLAEQVRGELALTRTAGRAPPSPFVGRAPERAALVEAVEAAMAGRGGVIGVEGEPGIGKSRLLSEIAASARWRGARVATGQATEYPTASPLAPLAELMREALADARAGQIAALLPPEALAALAPVYAWPDLPTLPELPPAQARQRFHQALAALVHALADITPYVLMLDDVHWASAVVWDALEACLAGLVHQRVLLVIAYRRVEIELTPGWAVLQRWEREGRLRALPLPPLNQYEVAQLLPPEQSAAAAEVLALTGGNPFYVVEALATRSLGQPLHTKSLHPRLAALPSAAREALEAAAVLGAAAPYRLWAATTGVAPLIIAQAAEPLTASGLLHAAPDGVVFAHDLIRAAVYQALPAGRRQALHLAAARGHAALTPDNLRAQAFHLDRAGVALEAAALYRRSGEQERGRFAFREAQAAFERALRLWPAAPTPERVETLLALVRVCDVLGQRERQRTALAEARAGAQQLTSAPLVLEALLLEGRLAAETARLDEAAACYSEALALARLAGDAPRQMEAAFLLGDLANRRGDHPQAQHHYEQVLAQARALDDQGRAARALRGLGLVARRSGRAREAIEWFEQAGRVQQALGDRTGESITRINLLSSYYDLNAWDRLLAEADAALALSAALGRQEGVALAKHLQGLASWALGDFISARAQLTEAVDHYTGLGDRVHAGLACNALGLVAEAEGDLAQARVDYERALATAEALGAATEAAYARNDLGALLHQQGEHDAARPLLEAARARWQELGNDLLRLKSEAHLGLVMLAAGARAEARALAEAGLTAFTRGGWSGEQPQGWLWALYRLLEALDRRQPAAAVLHGAYAELQRQGQAIANDRLRWQFFSRGPLNRMILDAQAQISGLKRQTTARLARAEAPLGRPLTAGEAVVIQWTVRSPDDELIERSDERRRHILRRLLAEAEAQGAAPTDADLARALGVARRTIERDLAAWQTAGQPPPTRRRKTAA